MYIPYILYTIHNPITPCVSVRFITILTPLSVWHIGEKSYCSGKFCLWVFCPRQIDIHTYIRYVLGVIVCILSVIDNFPSYIYTHIHYIHYTHIIHSIIYIHLIMCLRPIKTHIKPPPSVWHIGSLQDILKRDVESRKKDLESVKKEVGASGGKY